MSKLLLLSLLIMMIVIPVKASKARSGPQGLRRALTWFIGFNAVYWVTVAILWFTVVLGRNPAAIIHSVHD